LRLSCSLATIIALQFEARKSSLVKFPDVPEAITFGQSRDKALAAIGRYMVIEVRDLAA